MAHASVVKTIICYLKGPVTWEQSFTSRASWTLYAMPMLILLECLAVRYQETQLEPAFVEDTSLWNPTHLEVLDDECDLSFDSRKQCLSKTMTQLIVL